MSTDSPREIEAALKAIRDTGAHDDEPELVFDPRTGRLVVQQRGTPVSPDAAPATQIAREGYF